MLKHSKIISILKPSTWDASAVNAFYLMDGVLRNNNPSDGELLIELRQFYPSFRDDRFANRIDHQLIDAVSEWRVSDVAIRWDDNNDYYITSIRFRGIEFIDLALGTP